MISSAQTRLFWYAVPMYPFLAILAGVCIYHIFLQLKEKYKLKYKLLPYIFLVTIFIFPYLQILYKTWHKVEHKTEFHKIVGEK